MCRPLLWFPRKHALKRLRQRRQDPDDIEFFRHWLRKNTDLDEQAIDDIVHGFDADKIAVILEEYEGGEKTAS